MRPATRSRGRGRAIAQNYPLRSSANSVTNRHLALLLITRAGLAARGVLTALALSLFTALLLAAAAPASAVTHGQAAKRAVAALGSESGSAPVVVLGLPKPLRTGSRVTLANGKTVAKAGTERAFFFYEDSGPYQAYPHAGRVALVGATSGKVKLSKAINRAPRVNGALPAFLTSPKRYRSSKYRVFARSGGGGSAPSDPIMAGGPFAFPGNFQALGESNSPPKADKQTVTAKQDHPKSITLTGTDDESMILFEITKPPDHGTLSGTPPNVVYLPNPGYLGADDFSFRTIDDRLESNTAKVSINVVPLGSPPTVTTSAGCTAYVEQTPSVPVDGALTVADPDDTTLDSATVSITANFERGDDLLFKDQNGIIGSYDDVTGVLALSGIASLSNYQAALRTVRYRNLGGISPSATKDVSFTANDAGNDSAPATKQICISEGDASANHRPVGETSEGALNYVENDGPLPIDGAFIALDADSVNLSGATVRFTDPIAPGEDDEDEVPGTEIGETPASFAPAEDELGFTDQNGITGAYDDTTGVLTLSGVASVADYEAAVRSVTYENTSENPSPAARTIRFQVTDTEGASSFPSNRGVLVTPVNDAPVVTTTDGAGGYTEGDPATAVDAGLTVGDVDDTEIEGGQVRISDGFEAGDELVWSDQLGIEGGYDSETGVLTLTGTASVADYQTALRSIEFVGTSDDPPATKTVEFVVNDGDLDSAAGARTISVTGVNDKPVLVASGSSVSYTENDDPVAIDPGIAASDVDSDDFAGATVQITGNLASGEDVLALEDQNGITGSYESETGTLTLSGTSSVANYEAALRSVTYRNSSENPSTATRTVTFQVNDGGATENLSDPVTGDVGVTAVNDAPSVTTSEDSTSYTIGDDSGVEVDEALTVGDPDDTDVESAQVRIASGFEAGDELVWSDQLGIEGGYDTGTGVLTLTGSTSVADYETALRSIKFRAATVATPGSRTVEFTVNDGDADSAAASKGIELALPPPPNEAPVVTTSAGSSSYTLGDTNGSTVDSALTVTDADDVNLEGAQVQIEGFEPGDDLVWTDQLGITGSFDSEVGVLPLTGSAPLADYETALRSIKFRHAGDNQSAFRSVAFKVNDGSVDSAFSLKSIDLVTPPEL